jgi:hypothetical protein
MPFPLILLLCLLALSFFFIVAKGFLWSLRHYISAPPRAITSIVQKIIFAKTGQKEFFRAGKTSARY